MGAQKTIVDFIAEQMANAGIISVKKMFGEYIEGCAYPGAKPYLLIAGDQWDDSEWLSQLIKISVAQLPPPRKK